MSNKNLWGDVIPDGEPLDADSERLDEYVSRTLMARRHRRWTREDRAVKALNRRAALAASALRRIAERG